MQTLKKPQSREKNSAKILRKDTSKEQLQQIQHKLQPLQQQSKKEEKPQTAMAESNNPSDEGATVSSATESAATSDDRVRIIFK